MPDVDVFHSPLVRYEHTGCGGAVNTANNCKKCGEYLPHTVRGGQPPTITVVKVKE